MSQVRNEWVVRDTRVNAGLSWGLVVALAVLAVVGATEGAVVWAGYAALMVAVGVVPSAVAGRWEQTLPWPVLLVASLPLLWSLYGPTFDVDLASSLSVAVLALVVVVELQMLTSVRMTPGFAVWFTLVATLAATCLWAIVRYASQQLFGTPFVASNTALMYEFGAAVLAGLVAAAAFRWYFHRRLRSDDGTGEAAREEEVVA
ncbi:hypothetical protein [Halomarina ordinaria]|uniref:Uncharacterized protein n=1 Tax=Halomarina ordinaria TaxID=3033939 RepID=A0ABD5UD15_9EURY|nr:hypothetical protein [Halomarina sp. PSRA2]